MLKIVPGETTPREEESLKGGDTPYSATREGEGEAPGHPRDVLTKLVLEVAVGLSRGTEHERGGGGRKGKKHQTL